MSNQAGNVIPLQTVLIFDRSTPLRSTRMPKRRFRAGGAVVTGLLVLYMPANSVEHTYFCSACSHVAREPCPIAVRSAVLEGSRPAWTCESFARLFCIDTPALALRLRGGKTQVKGKRIKQPRKIHSIEQARLSGMLVCTCFSLPPSNTLIAPLCHGPTAAERVTLVSPSKVRMNQAERAKSKDRTSLAPA